ncbi:MAG: winged helix-turn-helix transcriptional regulator [Microbacterium sp.]|uniref:MarR family winged helix-turn-helix transcriptional regulator n=1 Tax=Microbacterium sp. TaxID=51671 RepID=UPI001D4CD73B|nr:MarR family winged helix-turn-helix transcriptional regulator [Microbacterium sp.]MBW8764535.1 winged helix-turn-helix transcriptional regulator [Microbacterium sp.]
MPTYAAPALSPAAELAINVLGGNAARLAILGFIVEHPGCLVSEIAKGTDLAIGTVKGHISALTATDVLDMDPAPTVPYADRRGRHTRYTVSADKLATHYRELGQLLGISE